MYVHFTQQKKTTDSIKNIDLFRIRSKYINSYVCIIQCPIYVRQFFFIVLLFNIHICPAFLCFFYNKINVYVRKKNRWKNSIAFAMKIHIQIDHFFDVTAIL